ncbi:hydroxyacid dehydrogenase [Streptacidiphilus carbonis]|uniref:hydroxyacid dehydrogenase n=1 Tax=Streptacidiphilus carbonis TaxID=105422 RepID=UPI000A79BF31|nr:hydroxyacid dehydrogenase [Streptacidiphilus carbonis]
MTTARPRTLLAMHPRLAPRILGPRSLAQLARVADLVPDLVADDFHRTDVAEALRDTEVLYTFWGCPPVDREVLAAAPRLRAIVHAAGSVKYIATEDSWRRGVRISSAAWANALPVAEYTVAAVLMSNKRLLQIREDFRERREIDSWHHRYPDIGNYRRTVGLIGASRIGRRVIELLRPFDLDVLVHDPYLSAAEALALGVRRTGLDELCAASDVLSIHAPALPETRHMVDRRRLALMPDGATLVNTARGSLVDTEALVQELASGRIHAVLDVTDPELLPTDSPLYDLPNVLLTPHVAGSVGGELHRMADSATAELARYAQGLPFQHPVLREELERTA